MNLSIFPNTLGTAWLKGSILWLVLLIILVSIKLLSLGSITRSF